MRDDFLQPFVGVAKPSCHMGLKQPPLNEGESSARQSLKGKMHGVSDEFAHQTKQRS
jgi:hypothetical protein